MTVPAHDQFQNDDRWVLGDQLGLPIPADTNSLNEGGTTWLTRAFRAFGSLDPDNQVIEITKCIAFEGGGTGTKASLSVRYARESNGLHEDLFVKFSRNFNDVMMDQPRYHMEPEVRFATLSRRAGFPIPVPTCVFAEFNRETGTGILITPKLSFGKGEIEPQYRKCLDHCMPDPLAHYQVLVGTLGRLAGFHQGGRLSEEFSIEFPFDREGTLARDRLPYSEKRLANRLARYRAFAENYPQLLPETIRSESFFGDLTEGAFLFLANESAIKRFMYDRSELIALCHWNANSDNAWFWADEAGELQCGLLDWGSVGQMHLAMSLWGCLSGAEQWIWHDHIDELLTVFLDEFIAAGGQKVNLETLRLHLLLQTVVMGLRWLLDAPPLIEREVPALADCRNPLDSRITESETARVQLQMLTNFLAFWEEQDFVGNLKTLLRMPTFALP